MTGGKRQQPPEGSRDQEQPTTSPPPESSSSESDPSEGHTLAGELPSGEPVPSEELEDLRERPEFWNGVLRAAGSEPRTARDIGGASGVRHGALAVGVDDIEKRLIVISSQGQAYGAALAQADIQSAIPDYRVIVVRPVVVSVQSIASAVAESVGSPLVRLKDLGISDDAPPEAVNAYMQENFLDVFSLMAQAINNAKSVGTPGLLQVIKQVIDELESVRLHFDEEDLTIDLTRTANRDASVDAQLGICGFPLSHMSGGDLDSFLDSRDLSFARDALQRYGVYQFFFPSPDQLLLGAIDRHAVISKGQQPSEIAQRLGHPAGEMELVPADTKLTDLIDALKDRNLLVDGEVSVELTEAGMAQRASVKFTPREGILSKIINRISVNLDLKQIFGVQIGAASKDERQSR